MQGAVQWVFQIVFVTKLLTNQAVCCVYYQAVLLCWLLNSPQYPSIRLKELTSQLNDANATVFDAFPLEERNQDKPDFSNTSLSLWFQHKVASREFWLTRQNKSSKKLYPKKWSDTFDTNFWYSVTVCWNKMIWWCQIGNWAQSNVEQPAFYPILRFLDWD